MPTVPLDNLLSHLFFTWRPNAHVYLATLFADLGLRAAGQIDTMDA